MCELLRNRMRSGSGGNAESGFEGRAARVSSTERGVVEDGCLGTVRQNSLPAHDTVERERTRDVLVGTMTAGPSTTPSLTHSTDPEDSDDASQPSRTREHLSTLTSLVPTL